MGFFGKVRKFHFDYFNISVHSSIRDRKHYKTVLRVEGGGEGAGLYHPPFQIYSSYLRDYIANWIRNIQAFPNAIKNLVSLIHLKYKS